MSYHNPVLLKPSVEALVQNPGGTYVDCTFGGGGHSREILSRLQDGFLVAFDQDADAAQNEVTHENFKLLRQNFRFLKNNLIVQKIQMVDGVLADLGVSSHQFDVEERGFSTRFDGPLDMRMNQNQSLTAEQVINQYSAERLTAILAEYADFPNARFLASKIVEARNAQPIQSVNQLKALFDFIPEIRSNKFFARLFQALRIEVNDEMRALKDLLQQSAEVIKPGGRLVVISYHSLEDRLVKRFMKFGNFSNEPIRDEVYGSWSAPFKPLGKVVVPDAQEQKENPRSRSAKMRIAQKV